MVFVVFVEVVPLFVVVMVAVAVVIGGTTHPFVVGGVTARSPPLSFPAAGVVEGAPAIGLPPPPPPPPPPLSKADVGGVGDFTFCPLP